MKITSKQLLSGILTTCRKSHQRSLAYKTPDNPPDMQPSSPSSKPESPPAAEGPNVSLLGGPELGTPAQNLPSDPITDERLVKSDALNAEADNNAQAQATAPGNAGLFYQNPSPPLVGDVAQPAATAQTNVRNVNNEAHAVPTAGPAEQQQDATPQGANTLDLNRINPAEVTSPQFEEISRMMLRAEEEERQERLLILQINREIILAQAASAVRRARLLADLAKAKAAQARRG
ncbi:hypothetical protein V8F20_006209 [Naviculisporaceae sp. PSN 640]